MDAANIPLPDTPDASHTLSATGAILAAPSTVPAAADKHPNAFLVRLQSFATMITNVFFPAPVREGWVLLFNVVRNRFVNCSAKYRYGFLALTILVALAEWQEPGAIPRPENLSNAIIGFLCATLLVFGGLALLDFTETNKWPWEEDGWVWPWEAWLWKETVYDLGASMNTYVGADTLPSPFKSPFTTETPASRPSAQKDIDRIAIPPSTIFKHPIIIPPTHQLPGGLRPSFLPPPTPTQIHKSGIMGESPMPPKFKHFSGTQFARNIEKLRAVSEWSGPANKPLEAYTKSAVPEKRHGEGEGREIGLKKKHVERNDIVPTGSKLAYERVDEVGKAGEKEEINFTSSIYSLDGKKLG